MGKAASIIPHLVSTERDTSCLLELMDQTNFTFVLYYSYLDSLRGLAFGSLQNA